MAIKIQGTPVIDDSRNLTNIGAIKGISYPTSDGTSGQVLTTDGSGSLSFQDLPPAGPTVEAVASGTLPDGSPVVVNSDGTVSVVEETAITESLGSASEFHDQGSNVLRDVGMAVDTGNNRFVIFYKDADNAAAGTAVVGTVSGTSLSFGTPVVFSTEAENFSAVYDSANGKIVVAYTHNANSSYGTAIVGTVSGTSISFGTAVVFESDFTLDISTAYDSLNDKVVIAYRDFANSEYGTAIVGTVSGTSISFGSPTVFETSALGGSSTVYDSANERIVIVYRTPFSGGGEAIVGTVSDTSISFGSSTVFDSGGDAKSVSFNENEGTVLIAYIDGNNSNRASAIVGTVSGTSISFGSTTVIDTGTNVTYLTAAYDSARNKFSVFYERSSEGYYSVGTPSGTSYSFDTPQLFLSRAFDYPNSVFDPVNDVVILAYEDENGAFVGAARALRNAGNVSNLVAENFIGFSNAAYSDAETATIQTGGSVTESQSGLTPGRTHFVQTDGTINITPDSPSVRAGIALSSTDLLIKG